VEIAEAMLVMVAMTMAMAIVMVRALIPACVGTMDAEVIGWPGPGRRQMVVCSAMAG
jgi:hypothetical protein